MNISNGTICFSPISYNVILYMRPGDLLCEGMIETNSNESDQF